MKRTPRTPLLLCLAAACLSAVPAGGAGVSLATWNLENYSLENRMTPDGYRKQYPKPEVQKTALRKTLLGLGADILLFQEMGDARFASELQRDLRRDGADYPHVRVMGDGPRNLAVFSKKAFETRPHPVVEFSLNGKTERLRRGLLEVFFPDEGLTVFVVHLKSRWTVDAADPRAARFRLGEAIAARDLVLKKFPEPADARFLIAGDFNDSRWSKPVQAFLARGKLKIAEYVDAADSRGEVWSYFYRREEEYARVDHLLASPALAKSVRGAGVLDGPDVTAASDHRPLWLRLGPPETPSAERAGEAPASQDR